MTMNHPLPSPSLLSDFCPPDQIMLLMVQPSCLTHIWFSIQIILYLQNYLYLYCNIKRGLKCHRDLSVEGKSRIWLSRLGFGKGWAPRMCKYPGQLQGSAMAQRRVRGEGKRCWSKPRAEMTLPGENTPWTPLLQGLKAPCCLSKMSSGHTPHSRLTVLRCLPNTKEQLQVWVHKSCWTHTATEKGSENGEGARKNFKWLNK